MKTSKLQINKWYEKNCTSASHLNDLYLNKVIKREVVSETEGFHWKSTTYRFVTHYGVELAVLSKYSDYGFCTQAYGVTLPKTVKNLKSPLRNEINMKVFMTDLKIYGKCPSLYAMSIRLRHMAN